MSIKNSFTRSYSEARAQFRVLADKADASISSLLIKRHSPTGAEEQVTGPSGEDLTIDIAWIGDTHPQRAFIHSSGTHGVEGFAGSAIQCDWFANRVKAAKDGSAIVFIHCINPYGMAWLRRCNENNVDLNRNFAEFPRRGKESSAYAKLDRFLNPRTTPSGDMAFYLAALGLMARYGFGRLQQVVAGGQYEYDRGLFLEAERLRVGRLCSGTFFFHGFEKSNAL
jgi:hypothetical protein